MAFGQYIENKVKVIDVKKPDTGETVAESLLKWIDNDIPTLLAIDAPLGWPVDLGHQLSKHIAGGYIETESNKLFRRITDHCVREITGKQSLDVGADRIARTAHAALRILHELRGLTGEKVSLAWDKDLKERISAIEVYPAATLHISGLRSTGYKKADNVEQRAEIINGLDKLIDFEFGLLFSEDGETLFDMDDDVLDSVVCVLAGADFLAGNVITPNDLSVAKKEGWIWVCPRRYYDKF